MEMFGQYSVPSAIDPNPTEILRLARVHGCYDIACRNEIAAPKPIGLSASSTPRAFG